MLTPRDSSTVGELSTGIQQPTHSINRLSAEITSERESKAMASTERNFIRCDADFPATEINYCLQRNPRAPAAKGCRYERRRPAWGRLPEQSFVFLKQPSP